MKNVFIVIFWGIIVISGISYFSNNNTTASSSSDTSNTYNTYDEEDSDTGVTTLTYDEAISDHWDEIKSYVDGTEDIEACYYGNGNCYTLEADISGGDVETIYFENGGYISLTGELDNNGEADATDDDGNDWSFELDMNSSIVENAVNDWASNNDY